MELKQAQKIAIGIIAKLSAYTEIIKIAGSIRRKKAEVKDIEIVCLPKKMTREDMDLFGKTISDEAIDEGFLNTVYNLGEIEKGNPFGRYCKIILPEGINLDLFIPEPNDYYRQFAIRTGSADYSFKIIASGWRKIGWVGSDLGLRLEKDCIGTKQPDGKTKWVCVRNKNNAPPVWESERDFFEWLKVPYLAPELRNI